MPDKEYKLDWNDVVVDGPVYEEFEYEPAMEEPLDARTIARLSDDDRDFYLCMECGANTLAAHEYFMLHDRLWQLVIPPHYQQYSMCVQCFEWFLGRRLISTDFTEAPVNYMGQKSERLRKRLGSYFLDHGGPYECAECEWRATRNIIKARNRLAFSGHQTLGSLLKPAFAA